MRIVAPIVLSCSLLSACSKPAASDVPGVYSARRSYGIEMLHLRTDGSYEQAFTSHGIARTNSGKWTFHPEKSFVGLDDALIFDDGWGRQGSIVRTSTWGLNLAVGPRAVSLS